jgi:hypothetical protein
MAENLKRSLPAPPLGVPLEVRQWMLDVQRHVDMIQRSKGDIMDSALRVRDLVDLGLIKIVNGAILDARPVAPPPEIPQLEFNPGFTGIFAVVDTDLLRTIHVYVSSGIIQGYSGRFEAVDSVTKQTMTVTVASGLLNYLDGHLEVIDPHNNITITLVITAGRIVALQ